jgi:hypothetical protein
MKVLAKVRSLASNGVISLLEINNLLFEEIGGSGAEFVTEDTTAVPPLNSAVEAA